MASESESESPVAGDGEPGRERSRDLGRRWVLAGLAVLVTVGAIVAWLLDRREPAVVTGAAAADAFLDASERNLDATYRLEGEFRRTLDEGRALVSGLLVVQRPPDRIQRSLGGTVGVVGGRTVNCGRSEGADYACAVSGEAEPWEVRRGEQLQALQDYVLGDDPLYAVEEVGNDCFRLERRLSEPEAVYGRRAELCFDRATGALRRLEVRREGGATDVLEGLVVTGRVSDGDFDLSADDTYDPQGA
ncbi:hypothetical protein [Rhabdothermincola salaria]|uniref:hypothetical protein n=1 Tax=Rhabdothermincola salaria TaxID=2903142 RepID=UPI001E3546FF|nr:hypothetical protein [Rhabdothermincola salaria]MCD9624493.1 hypothetical protein [Rhabdothermincola salaria]